MDLSALTDRFSAYLPKLLAAVPLAVVIIIGAYLVNVLAGRALLLLAHRTNMNEMDVMPFRRIVRWITRLLATILVLSVFGFQIGGVWAVLSTLFGLVAIGFVAVWSLISHTSATMLILFLHPFQMGDDLEFPGEPVRGRAVNLNFFFTTLIDHEGRFFQIPNNLFFQKTFKRQKNPRIVSLAAQLNSRTPVKVALPPPPDAAAPTARPKEPDPLMSTPDPKSFMPPDRKP